MASTTMKLLVPLSTAALAAAVALGSGATWTSESATSISVTGGDIFHETNGAVDLLVTGLKPGASVTGTITLENTGDLDSTISIEESVTSNEFHVDADALAVPPVLEQDWLELVIVASSVQTPDFSDVTIDNGSIFGGLATATEIDGLVIEPGETVDLEFTLTLDADTPNAFQEAAAAATYTFVTTQTDASDTNPADGNDDEAEIDGWGAGAGDVEESQD